jgi:hypothetical protein
MFGKLLSAVIEVAKLPVDVARDTMTGGGILTSDDGRMDSAIKKRIENVQRKLESMDK